MLDENEPLRCSPVNESTLSGCVRDGACYKCLKHYRFYAMQLLNRGVMLQLRNGYSLSLREYDCGFRTLSDQQ